MTVVQVLSDGRADRVSRPLLEHDADGSLSLLRGEVDTVAEIPSARRTAGISVHDDGVVFARLGAWWLCLGYGRQLTIVPLSSVVT